MNTLNGMWEKVINSKTANKEEEYIDDIWKYIGKNNITIMVRVVDANGIETELANLPDKAAIKTANVMFVLKDGNFQAKSWYPKDNDNIYLLFRE